VGRGRALVPSSMIMETEKQTYKPLLWATLRVGSRENNLPGKRLMRFKISEQINLENIHRSVITWNLRFYFNV
jgi:hypothetical protein